VRPGPPPPRRPLLLLPLALAACSPPPAPRGPRLPAAPGRGEVQRLLDARAAALLAGDLSAAGAGYAPADRAALRVRDGRALAAGLREWAVDVGAPGPAGAVTGTSRVRVEGEGRAVSGTFRAGWDGRLRTAGDGTPQPWDLGEVAARVVEGGVLLVVGPGTGDAEPARQVVEQAAADLGAATARVDAVWGADWPRGTGVVVVPTAAEVARLAGRDPSGQLDAVAVGADAALPDGAPAGVRVVLAVERFAALTPLGRTVTLTHELVHVATRATAAAAGAVVPRWLTEGYADHVARLDRDVPAAALAAPLLAARGTPRVPDDAAFTASDAAAVQLAYAAAWTLVTSAARVAGTPAVTALVRAVRAGTELERACRDALGRPFGEVVATWRADVAGDLVGWGP
jgi:hypothetical protein